jgi:hypothetical protein
MSSVMPEKEEYIVPSNPVDRQTIKDALTQAADSLMRQDAEKDLRKDIAGSLKDQFEMPTSTFNQLAMSLHKQNIKEKQSKAEALSDNYSLLFGSDSI